MAPSTRRVAKEEMEAQPWLAEGQQLFPARLPTWKAMAVWFKEANSQHGRTSTARGRSSSAFALLPEDLLKAEVFGIEVIFLLGLTCSYLAVVTSREYEMVHCKLQLALMHNLLLLRLQMPPP